MKLFLVEAKLQVGYVEVMVEVLRMYPQAVVGSVVSTFHAIIEKDVWDEVDEEFWNRLSSNDLIYRWHCRTFVECF